MARRRSVRVFTLVGAMLASIVPGVLSTGSATAGSGANGFSTHPDRGGSTLATPNARWLAGSPEATVGPNRPVIFKNGAQSETAIAVNPTNPNHLLGASNDLADTTTVYESFDGGHTWAADQAFEGTAFCYDPWLDFNAVGDAFFAYECSDQRVAYKRAGTANWVTDRLENAGSFPDRDMIVTDDTASSPFAGSVYIGYDDNGNCNSAHLMVSRTGFGNWLQTPKINDDSCPTFNTIGVNAAVGPDGTVYAAWEDFDRRRLEMDASFNGGQTWGTDRLVHNYRLATEQFFISIPPQPQRGVLPMPMTATAPAGTPNAGRLYIAYFDSPAGGGGGTNCYVRFSDNDGVTWSPERKVNDDATGAYNFHCAIAVGTDGTVGVSFYTTRFDPTNRKAAQAISFSFDGGIAWDVDTQVATRASDESGFGDPNDYGDYQEIDAGPDGLFHPVWTDSRPGTRGEDVATAWVDPLP
jgi:hypothetical protein